MMIWSPGDIGAYRQVESEKLDKLYEQAGIPANEPEKREKYLLEEYLKLSASDYRFIFAVYEKFGYEKFNGTSRNVNGLNLLEDIVISRENKKPVESKKQTS